jgi:hypothetical protein
MHLRFVLVCVRGQGMVGHCNNSGLLAYWKIQDKGCICIFLLPPTRHFPHLRSSCHKAGHLSVHIQRKGRVREMASPDQEAVRCDLALATQSWSAGVTSAIHSSQLSYPTTGPLIDACQCVAPLPQPWHLSTSTRTSGSMAPMIFDLPGIAVPEG